jgi:hypothetical protein
LSGHTGFFLSLFFLQPCLVPVPGRPGPRSTCRTWPSFKTMNETILASSLVVGLENLFLFSFYSECNELIFWIYKLHVKYQEVASFYFEGLFCTTTSFFFKKKELLSFKGCQFRSVSSGIAEMFHTNSKNGTKRNKFHLILNLGPFRIFRLNSTRNVPVSFHMFRSALEKSLNQIEPCSI